jgi:hypothetical protein
LWGHVCALIEACFCAVCIQMSGSDPRRPERRQRGSFIARSS